MPSPVFGAFALQLSPFKARVSLVGLGGGVVEELAFGGSW